jgi:hypothetical protein
MYVCVLVQLHECFYKEFGVDKQRRIGQVTCEANRLELNPRNDDTGYFPENLAKLGEDRTRMVRSQPLSRLNPFRLLTFRCVFVCVALSRHLKSSPRWGDCVLFQHFLVLCYYLHVCTSASCAHSHTFRLTNTGLRTSYPAE